MVYPAGWKQIATALGTEQVPVVGPGATNNFLTSQQIANLAATGARVAITALSTVGAGTITAAGIIGGITSRAGSQSNTAFTDTTATGALIDAALTDPQVGQSWAWSYQNTTDANATISGGSGVTVSGITVVPGKTTAFFLVTRTAASTYTVVGFAQTVPTGASGTFTANEASAVTVTDSRVTANSVVVFGLKTVGGTPAGQPFMATVTAGTGFTVKSAVGDTSVWNYTIIG